MNAFYIIAATLSWGCIFTVLVFDVAFGLRARFRVKRERVTSLPEGFSPLDYQRVMKGKTRPERLTRALLVWWAQKGYLEIKKKSAWVVKARKIKDMPPHEEASFYDRGTYVREREIFNFVFHGKAPVEINLNRPLINRKNAEKINKSFSIGENEGVFGAGHFILKIVTQILCFVPYFLAIAWASYYTGDIALYVGVSIFSVIGVLMLKYMYAIPAAFRIPFFSLWGGAPYVMLIVTYLKDVYDPWYFGVSALAFYALGTFFFLLFADYREKENLKEYSTLYNFRQYLLFVNKKAVDRERYYEILPMLYTINFAFLLKGKFRAEKMPPWYHGNKGGTLL